MENPGGGTAKTRTGTAELEKLAKPAEAARNYLVCSMQTKREVKHILCGLIAKISHFPNNEWESYESGSSGGPCTAYPVPVVDRFSAS